MSLKAFHIFFVAVCVLFAVWFGIWEIAQWRTRSSAADLALGLFSLACVPVLLIYGCWFLRKLRNVSYI